MTAVALHQLDARRQVALAESGWGGRVHLFQPRNLAFWVYVLLVAAGLGAWLTRLGGQFPVYRSVIVVSTVVFTVYGAVFWWFTRRIDRYARQNPKLIILAFLWGGFAATWVMAATANNALNGLWTKAFGQQFALDWGAGLSAPFTEELAKASGLLLLIALAPRQVATAFDGFILGAFLGLGFQLVEDVSYAMHSAADNFGTSQLGSAATTIVLRVVAGVAAHVLYSAVFCAGLVYFLGRPAQSRRRGRGLALMLSAMVMHGVWDATEAIFRVSGAMVLVVLLAITLIEIAVVVYVFHLTVPVERQFMHDVMAPEVPRGTITERELAALAGSRKARRAYRKSAGSRKRRAHARQVLDAANDLAGQLAASGGADSPGVAYARAEVRRMRES